MAKPTLIGDHLAAKWNSLTDEQRSCWLFWAMANPITSAKGHKLAMYGYEAYVQRNSLLAAMDPELALTDPPANATPPPPAQIRAVNWQKKSKVQNAFRAYNGQAYLQLVQPLPAGCNLMVKQTFQSISKSSGRPARSRHVTYAKQGEPPLINIVVPRGYYASTAGANKYASIKGRTARRKKQLPFARVIIIDLATGNTREQTVGNPG